MASNYNSRPKPEEIIIKNKEAKLISKREEVKDLYAREIII